MFVSMGFEFLPQGNNDENPEGACLNNNAAGLL